MNRLHPNNFFVCFFYLIHFSLFFFGGGRVCGEREKLQARRQKCVRPKSLSQQCADRLEKHRFWWPIGLRGAASNQTDFISQLVRFDCTLTLTSASRRHGSSLLWVKQTKSLQFESTIAYWLFLLKFADEVSIRATAEVFRLRATQRCFVTE